MRRLITLGLVLALASSSALGQVVAGDTTGPTTTKIPTTLKFLNERVEEVTFEDAPLDQVMEWIADLTPMNVVTRWQILEDAGVERDKPISMHVRNLRLSQVLWMIMDEAGGSDLKLAYRASGELLIISTSEDLGKEMLLRVYDVSDLLVEAQDFYGAPNIDLSQVSQNSGSGGGSNNLFDDSGNDEDENNRNDDEDNASINELITLIVQTVEPDSWADNGGLGTIQAFRNLLVVRNNILVHQALGGYVEETD